MQSRMGRIVLKTAAKNRVLIKNTINKLPAIEEDVMKFREIPIEDISSVIHNNIIEDEGFFGNIKAADSFVAPVLVELKKLKKDLGGSPVFGLKTPTIHDADSKKTLFGIPLPAVKDWFSMTLVKEWRPKFFWRGAAKLFKVYDNKKISQFEKAWIQIQRFGLLVVHEQDFIKILDSGNEKRYNELSKITGLAWHPKQNAISTEKEYFKFVKQFLTEYFEDAKKKGKKALKEYFEAFDGVCFEDRVRIIEEYAIKHPLSSEKVVIPQDWDSKNTAEEVYMKEVMELGLNLHGLPTVEQLFEHLQAKKVFDNEFTTLAGGKAKPTKEEFDIWAKEQVENCILSQDNYDNKMIL